MKCPLPQLHALLNFTPFMRLNIASRFLILALGTFCLSGFADTVTLKSGEKIEGKITAESDTEITLDVKISAAVTDTRTVAKSEVASVEKQQPDEMAWNAIQAIKLGPNSMPASAYDTTINSLKAFATQFPASTHLEDVNKLRASFEEEKARVEAGELKLDGKWLAKEDVERESYQIKASLAFNFMKDQAARGDLVGALNTFDALEKQFPGARIFPDAVELGRRVIGTLKIEVERRKQQLPLENAEREKALKTGSDQQRAEIQSVIQREQATAEAALNAAKNLKWPPFLPRSEKSITAIASKLPDGTQRLNSYDTAKLRGSLVAAEEAQTAIAANDSKTAETAVRKALDLWPTNEVAKRLQVTLNDAKKVAASEAAAAAEAARNATPAPTTPRATPIRSTADAAPATHVEEEKPFLLTAGGAVTVVVVMIFVTAGFLAFRKIKRRSNEVLE